MISRIFLATCVTAATVLFALATTADAQSAIPGAHFIENWDGDGDLRVTLPEVEAQRDNLFSSFDSDDDGILTADEYEVFDAARNADVADQPARAQQMLKPVVDGIGLDANDANGDGAVSHQEFIDGAADWLTRFDMDADGAMTPADFKAILGSAPN